MKKYFNFLLLAALLCGMSLSVASCKSDDDNNNSGGGGDSEVVADGLSEEAMYAWSWISALTDETTQVDGWQTKSFDATIGQQSDNDPGARLIFVSDLDDAKTSFASIAGCDPEELNGTKTVTAGEYGSMTWNISAPGAPNIATVDVDSKLLKKLSKIVFCTEEQAPDNATEIKGNCYYRIGDVIEDSKGYYWVCVQSSFAGKKNYDSYWVNVFNADKTGRGDSTKLLPGIPKENIQAKWDSIAKYNYNIIKLPTGLKIERKQVFNLANLILALKYPDDYLEEFGGKYGLAGLPSDNHYRNFVDAVKKGWNKHKIYAKLFNQSSSNLMEQLPIYNFFYNGYHWKAGTTAGVWIFSADQIKQYSGSLKTDDILFEMKRKNTGFDIRRYVSDPLANKKCASTGEKGVAPQSQFTDLDYTPYYGGFWVVRGATGKQLDKNYNPYKPIKGVFNIYNFNIEYDFKVGEKEIVPDAENSQLRDKVKFE